MEIDLDTGRLWVFIAGFMLFFNAETLLPARCASQPRWQRLAFHGLVAALNTIIVRLFVFVPFLLWTVYVETQGWGIARWLGLTGWVELLAAVIVLDAFDYFWHRANHRVSFLWRMHKAHHADTAIDVTTALRFHPGELLLSGVAKAVWVAVWGPSVIGWFLFEALVSLCAQFHHGNFDFPRRVDDLLQKALVTPRFHALHHAVDRRFGDRNFSTIFSIWDPLFGTAVAPASGRPDLTAAGAVGLPEARHQAFSLSAWLLEPFTARNMALAQRHGPMHDSPATSNGEQS